jgi:hypothetical protein
MNFHPRVFVALVLLAIAFVDTASYSGSHPKHHPKPTPTPTPTPTPAPNITLAWDPSLATTDPA